MHILRNFTWWVDGKSMHLEIDELQLPNIKDKLEEVRVGDMGFDVSLGIEKLEAKAKLFTRNPDIMAQMGIRPGVRLRSTFRGQTVDETNGQSAAEVVVMEHRISGEPEAWKSGSKAGVGYTLNSLLYYKHSIDTRVIHLIDPVNMERIVDGVDQLAATREALGFAGAQSSF